MPKTKVVVVMNDCLFPTAGLLLRLYGGIITATALQNDFAFYRRNFSKISKLPEVKVNEAEANIISMFIAQVRRSLITCTLSDRISLYNHWRGMFWYCQNLPMMVSCEKSVKAMGEGRSEQTCKILAFLAHVMCGMASQKDLEPDKLR